MKSGKMSRYFTYALGEILLVVIGILLALKINVWNEARIEQRTISSYFERITVELLAEEKKLNGYHDRIQTLKELNQRTLRLVRSEETDSLLAMKETLGALGTAWAYTFNMPVTDEFLSQNFLKRIENDSIKIGFQAMLLSKKRLDRNNEYTSEQYVRIIEPFFHKYINYSEVALDRYQPLLEKGGPETDYRVLKDNLEFWNIITFKLENLSMEAQDVIKTSNNIRWLREKIRDELQHSEQSD